MTALTRKVTAYAYAGCLAALIVASPIASAAQVASPPVILQLTDGVLPEGESDAPELSVQVVLTVSSSGLVTKVEIPQTQGEAIDGAVTATAQQWTFEPASRDGKPVAAKIRAIVRLVAATPPAPEVPLAPIEGPPSTPLAAKAPEVIAPAPAAPTEATPTPPAPEGIVVRVEGEAQPRSASDVVLKKETLEAAPHKTAGDLLLSVPGVFVSPASGQGQAHRIFLRGFDAANGQDLEIWVGGAPVNEVSNIHGQGYADLNFVMPELVKSLRATPGTYDPRQGDFAVAGSMAFDLGYDEPGVTAAATLGTYGEQRYFVAYRPTEGPDETFAAFETQSTDGFGPSRAARHTTLTGQALYDLTPSLRVRVLGIFYAARFSSPGVVRLADIEDGTVDRFDTYDPSQGGDAGRTQVVIELTSFSDESRERFSFSPFFVRRQLRLRQNLTGYLQDPIDGDSTQQINETTTIGATGSYGRKLSLVSDRDAFEVGVLARNDWVEQEQLRLSAVSDRTTATLVDASVRATDLAAYGDLSLRPWSRVLVRGGVRIDGLAYATKDRYGGVGTEAEGATGGARAALGAHIGPKASVDVRVWRGLRAIVSYGEGFRSPQARSLGDGEKTPFTTVRSFEGGLRYADGERIGATASAFHTRLSDDLAFDVVTTRNERTPSTERTGFAADFRSKPVQELLLGSSVTYTRASFTEGDALRAAGDLLPYVPQLIARTDAAFTPTLARFGPRALDLHAGTGLTFMGMRPLPYSEFGHAIFLVDASLGLRLKEVEIRAEMFNVLDADWFDGEYVYASSFTRGSAAGLVPLRHVTVGSPRTFFATLQVYL